jgi:hypothetical protein
MIHAISCGLVDRLLIGSAQDLTAKCATLLRLLLDQDLAAWIEQLDGTDRGSLAQNARAQFKQESLFGRSKLRGSLEHQLQWVFPG